MPYRRVAGFGVTVEYSYKEIIEYKVPSPNHQEAATEDADK